MEELKDLNKGGGQSYGFTLYRSSVGKVSEVKLMGRVKDRAIVSSSNTLLVLITYHCNIPYHLLL